MASDDMIGEGHRWYADGQATVADIADRAGIGMERAAIIVAHLSPRTRWSFNVAGAYQLAIQRQADGCMANNVARALAALDADDPWSTFGPMAHKTRRFARNLLGDHSVITVDTWAMRVAMGRGWGVNWRTDRTDDLERLITRPGIYEAIERAYLNAGKHANLPGPIIQAITWVAARNGRPN